MPSQGHSHAPSARYNSARDRRRVIWAILSLAIVLVAFGEARKPSNWTWLAPNPRDAGPPASSAGSLLAEKEALGDDQVRIVAPRVRGGANAGRSFTPRDLKLRIATDLLDAVEDSRVGVRAAEVPAYFAMLTAAQQAPAAAFETAARDDLGFASLMNDPVEHRGEIVLLQGQLRRFLPIEAGPNDGGFDQLYEGWLFTEEAGRKNPYRIICSSKPAGFPEGDEVREQIRFAGYFFKRLNYATAHGQHAAPMFIGREFQWIQQLSSASPAERITPVLAGITLVLAAILAGVIYRARRLERERANRRATTIGVGEPASPTAAREFLRELERSGDSAAHGQS